MDDYQDNTELTEKSNNPELQKGREYIIKRTTYDPFYVRILDVTEKMYHFQYENGNKHWLEKDYYHKTYTFVEDITEFNIYVGTTTFMEQEFEQCPACHGSGSVPDDSSTAGSKICPVCGGSRQILKRTLLKG